MKYTNILVQCIVIFSIGIVFADLKQIPSSEFPCSDELELTRGGESTRTFELTQDCEDTDFKIVESHITLRGGASSNKKMVKSVTVGENAGEVILKWLMIIDFSKTRTLITLEPYYDLVNWDTESNVFFSDCYLYGGQFGIHSKGDRYLDFDLEGDMDNYVNIQEADLHGIMCEGGNVSHTLLEFVSTHDNNLDGYNEDLHGTEDGDGVNITNSEIFNNEDDGVESGGSFAMQNQDTPINGNNYGLFIYNSYGGKGGTYNSEPDGLDYNNFEVDICGGNNQEFEYDPEDPITGEIADWKVEWWW